MSLHHDRVLAPLLSAADDAARRHEVERLIVTRARPVVERVIRRYAGTEWMVRAADADDIASTAILRLLRRLDTVADAGGEPIGDLEDYVATLTYHTIYDFLRQRHPERMRMRNRVRYLLTHDSRFALWDHRGTTLCGSSEWRGRTDVAVAVNITAESASMQMVDDRSPSVALAAVFSHIGRPVVFATLMNVMVSLWRGGNSPAAAQEQAFSDPVDALSVRQTLQRLWSEVRLLPVRQRGALLLNLRDTAGGNAVALIPLSGVATFDELAASLEMTAETLAEIWSELPLPDLRIAELFGITRQQVINLRQAARERLSRRMKGGLG
jgi:RNA polymerase sigma factor (sigma-70 family)